MIIFILYVVLFMKIYLMMMIAYQSWKLSKVESLILTAHSELHRYLDVESIQKYPYMAIKHGETDFIFLY